jgi:hypothetical protein
MSTKAQSLPLPSGRSYERGIRWVTVVAVVLAAAILAGFLFGATRAAGHGGSGSGWAQERPIAVPQPPPALPGS